MAIRYAHDRHATSRPAQLSPLSSIGPLPILRFLLPLERLSVRRRILITLVAVIALAGAQWAMTLLAVDSAAFMLKRAETSYKQLREYQQLSIDELDYVLSRRSAAPAPAPSDPARATVETELARLGASIVSETAFVRAHGGDEDNDGERRRLDRINVTAAGMFNEPNEDGVRAIYRARLQPLLTEAIEGEQSEIAVVEQAMRQMQRRMRWIGVGGVIAQALVLITILILANRSVLDPLSRLVADIRQHGRGRLAHRVAVDQHDEFGLLSRHINRMARQLERRQQSLVDANGRLEATVAERTRSLRDKNEELREVDERRRQFFADVSHELRTPLTAIVGEADVTLRINQTDGEAYRESLRAILANAAFLNRRVDDLLALARSSDGQLRLQRETVDLQGVAAEVTVEIGGLAKINDVTVRFDSVATPLRVRGDRARLKQALMILLDNAVKFSPPSQTIEVVLADYGETASIAVTDRGSGVGAAEIPHLFERYYQTEDGRRMGGTGLGLAIARRIVEAHEGTICAASSANEGTTITMTLPTVKGVQS